MRSLWPWGHGVGGGFPGGASDKELIGQCRRHKRCGFDPWVRNIHWRGHDNPLQYSSLGNLMDKGAWQATVHEVAKNLTQRKHLRTQVQVRSWEWGPSEWDYCHCKSHWRACFYCSVLSHTRIPCRTLSLQLGREGSHQTPTLLHPHPGLPASRTTITQFLLFISLPVSGYVVREAWAKTFSYFFPLFLLPLLLPSPPSSNKVFSSFPALASSYVECVLSDTAIYCINSREKKKIEMGSALMNLLTWCGRLICNNERNWTYKCKFWNVL